LLVRRLTVGPLGTNCYLVAATPGAQAAVIDPGGESARIMAEAETNDLLVVYVINTHGHSDHVAANREVMEATGAKLAIGELDAPLLSDPVANISAFTGEEVRSPEADVLVDDGDRLELGRLNLRIMHTPGHTAGGISILAEDVLFSGDTLFAGSVGRTDLPGGSPRQLAVSLRTKIEPLDDDVTVYPGHGESTTIGREKLLNPFLRGDR